MQTEAQRKAKAKYQKEKVKSIAVAIYPTETDIEERLQEVVASGEKKVSYIKRLIREDIERQKESHLSQQK